MSARATAPACKAALMLRHAGWHLADPWRHIAACLLCSRTTGGPVVREAMTGLLARWPSPSALLDARAGEVLEAMHPLGLQVSAAV